MKLVRSTDSGALAGIASTGEAIDRRTFLKRSGVTLGAGVAASMFAPSIDEESSGSSRLLTNGGNSDRDPQERLYSLFRRMRCGS